MLKKWQLTGHDNLVISYFETGRNFDESLTISLFLVVRSLPELTSDIWKAICLILLTWLGRIHQLVHYYAKANHSPFARNITCTADIDVTEWIAEHIRDRLRSWLMTDLIGLVAVPGSELRIIVSPLSLKNPIKAAHFPRSHRAASKFSLFSGLNIRSPRDIYTYIRPPSVLSARHSLTSARHRLLFSKLARVMQECTVIVIVSSPAPALHQAQIS